MKIAFNIDYDPSRTTGIGRYGTGLMSAWAETGLEYEVWISRGYHDLPASIKAERNRIHLYPGPRRISDICWPSVRSVLHNVKWVHSSTGIMLPRSPFFKQVVMIHDLGPFLYGQMKSDEDTMAWQERIRNIVNKADCIVVNSTSTGNDLLTLFPCAEGRVFTTPLGIDHFSISGTRSENRDHILAVGTVEPRKNIDGLLRAYRSLHQRKSLPPLIIAGMDGFRAEEIKNLPQELGIADRVTFYGFCTDEQLADLFARAYCLVHPAHHEGFGLTVPEAFAWNLPVVGSNTGGLEEFFAETAWMVDPSDDESIACGIELALEKGVTELQESKRKELTEVLSWKNCVDKTVSALKAAGR